MRLVRAAADQQARALTIGRRRRPDLSAPFRRLRIGTRRFHRACARRSFDTATICMALVIFCVDLTEAIRFLSSFSDGIAQRLRARFKTGAYQAKVPA